MTLTLKELQIPKQEMRVITDVFTVLDRIKDRYRIVIVSNHYTWLIESLNNLKLAPYFEAIIISESVGVAKPDIRIMQILLDKLKLEAESCLYVGDQPMDVLCSKEIGMDCAWIADKEDILPELIPYQEDFRISRISDLLNILL